MWTLASCILLFSSDTSKPGQYVEKPVVAFSHFLQVLLEDIYNQTVITDCIHLTSLDALTNITQSLHSPVFFRYFKNRLAQPSRIVAFT